MEYITHTKQTKCDNNVHPKSKEDEDMGDRKHYEYYKLL